MATTIPQRVLRNDVSSVLRRVEAGEEFIVTVSGRPVAELRPWEAERRGSVAAFTAALEQRPPLTQEELDGLAAVDAEIRQLRHDDRPDAWDRWG